MTLYRGRPYGEVVTIGPVDPSVVRRARKDEATSGNRWLDEALKRDDIMYFTVCEHGKLVGEVFLHSIDHAARISLVGYHLFAQAARGRGVGTEALRLLQQYARAETRLGELVAITSADNVASQRVAERCGFVYSGPPLEDPTGRAYVWKVH